MDKEIAPMKRFRSAAVLALVVLFSGASSYGAVGMIGAGLGRATRLSMIPVLSPSAPNPAAVLSVPLAVPAALPAPALIPAVFAVSPAVESISIAAGPRIAVETINARLPASFFAPKSIENMAIESRGLFDGAALRFGSSSRGVLKKDMPYDEVDENGNPSPRDGGIDDLGNASRGGGGGPDDRSDPDQSDRGGSVL
ncbi:MAG: hypothetical protein HY403_10435 [Elusimicrobia bacterium]|nr:hypothetical protein [Elusimicrobiota bacterium]